MFRGAFFSYGRKFAGHMTPLSKRYLFPKEKHPTENPPNTIVVGSEFVVSQEVLEDFKAHLRSIKVEFDGQKFSEAEDEIKRQVEREVVSAASSAEEGMKAFMKTDPVVLKALELLPEARKFVESQIP